MRTPDILSIYLNRQETMLLLEALVERPFKQVFEIIGKLNKQLPLFDQTPDAQPCPLRADELSCCVKALGDLPYHRVHALVNAIHQQIMAQQEPAAPQTTTREPIHE